MNIAKAIKKPSVAVEAAFAGVVGAKDNPRFLIDMNSFGRTDNFHCIGCQATATLIYLFPGKINVRNVSERVYKALSLKTTVSHLAAFEAAIDALRYGKINSLLDYFNVDPDTTSRIRQEVAEYFGSILKFRLICNTNYEDTIWQLLPIIDILKKHKL
jgi:hypothetical protein